MIRSILVSIFFLGFSIETAHSHYVTGCYILDEKFNILRNFPGLQCIFNEDGSYVQTDAKMEKVESFNFIGEKIWSRKIQNHHQLNLSLDKKRILALESDVLDKKQGCLAYYDAFSILDLKTGKTLYRYSLRDHQREFYKKYLAISPIKMEGFKNCEISHFNSFYEIPENQLSKKIPAFKKGNYLVNSLNIGFFILDNKLKKILWAKHPRDRLIDNIHDAQVINEGILYYNNYGDVMHPYEFTINVYDPINDKMKTIYPLEDQAKKIASFMGIELEVKAKRKKSISIVMGGVQLTSKGFLFNVNSKTDGGEFYLVDYKGKTIVEKNFSAFGKNSSMPTLHQQIKEVELSRFLEKNKL